jgi:hypothetical protein
MRFERQKRMVSWDKRAQQLWGKRASTAAGINTTTTETVHKSTFALMGHAVPSSALPRLLTFPLLCGRSEQ